MYILGIYNPTYAPIMRYLRHKIALIMGLISLFTLLTVSGIIMYSYERKLHQQAAQQVLDTSETLPLMLDFVENALANLCRTFASTEEFVTAVASLDSLEIKKLSERFVISNLLDYVQIYDSSGGILYYAGDKNPQSEANPLSRFALSNLAEKRGLIRSHGAVYVAVVLPIFYKKTFLGAIIVGHELNYDLLHQLENVPEMHFTVWPEPHKQALIPHFHDSILSLYDYLTDDEIFSLLNSETVSKAINIGNHKQQAAFFAQPVYGSTFPVFSMTYRSLEFLSIAQKETFIQLGVLVLILSVFLMWFSWWIAIRITEPLTRLTQSAKRMAELDFTQSLPVQGRDEVSLLAVSFNELSESLQQNIAQKDEYARELAELNWNLEQLVDERTSELEITNRKLQREMAEKDDFLRAVSHDLGAPLRNIGGLVISIERKYGAMLDADLKDRLQRIQSNAQRELQLIDQLLQLSRIKTRRSQSEEIDLSILLQQVLQDLSFEIEEKNMEIRLPESFPIIQAEANLMRQLFQNLIDNAIKYSHLQEEPLIEIGYKETPQFHQFFVQDNGAGIPEDQKDAIFGVFRRVKRPEISQVAGQGIGLTTVKTIVSLYGGEIWVDSQLGKGSTFYFTLAKSLVRPTFLAVEVD
ncbi:MAG: ATP-binding protein [bacterium]